MKHFCTSLNASIKNLNSVTDLDLLRPSGVFVGLNDDFDYTGGALAETPGPSADTNSTDSAF